MDPKVQAIRDAVANLVIFYQAQIDAANAAITAAQGNASLYAGAKAGAVDALAKIDQIIAE